VIINTHNFNHFSTYETRKKVFVTVRLGSKKHCFHVPIDNLNSGKGKRLNKTGVTLTSPKGKCSSLLLVY